MASWACGLCTFLNEKGAQACAMCTTPKPSAGGSAAYDDLPPAYVDVAVPPIGAAQAETGSQARSALSQLEIVERQLFAIEIALDEQDTLKFLDRRLDGPADKLQAATRELKEVTVNQGDLFDVKKKASLTNTAELLTKRLHKLRSPQGGDTDRETSVVSPSQGSRMEDLLRAVEKRLFDIELVVDQQESRNIAARRLDTPADNLEALEKELARIDVKPGDVMEGKKKATLGNNIDLLKKRIHSLRLDTKSDESRPSDNSKQSAPAKPIQIRVGDLKWKHHEQHPLSLRNCPYGPGNLTTCSQCRNKVSIAFHCAADRFDVCVDCVATRNPDTVRHAWRSASHAHPLHLVSHPYKENGPNSEWKCDLCQVASGTTKAVYHCPECKFDCCISCSVGISPPTHATPPPVRNPVHNNAPANPTPIPSIRPNNANFQFEVRRDQSRDLGEMWIILLEMHQSMKSTSLGNISLTANEAQQSMRNMYVALVTYENAIQAEAQQQDWLGWKRKQWRDAIQQSSNWSLAHFATCALALEHHVRQTAQKPEFLLLTRDDWRVRCVRAGGKEMVFDNTAQAGNIDGLQLLRLLQLLS